jgi:hypothetical protein
MIGFKGRFSPIRQYLPSKPTKWGFKIWTLCDDTGYTFNQKIYTGSDINEEGEKITHKNLGYEVVMNLVEPYKHMGFVVISDNYFTSLKLASELNQNGFHFLGQIKLNAIGLPKEWIKETKEKIKRKGEFDWVMKNNILFTLWHDTKINGMIGTSPNLLVQYDGSNEKKFKSEVSRIFKSFIFFNFDFIF